MDDEAAGEDLPGRLREAGPEELRRLVEGLGPRLEARLARLVLRNPFVTAEVVTRIASREELAAIYEVRRDVVMTPSTPRPLALSWLAGLGWTDLVRAGAEARLHPVVRRAADLRLLERLPGLAEGEKVAIARSAGVGLLAQLRHDGSARVLGALLDNPRLTEGLLAPLLASESVPPANLALVARHRKWGHRPAVKVAIVRNPRAPAATALALLAGLRKVEQAAVAADPRLADAVRRRARLLAGGEGPADVDLGPRPR